VATSLDLRPSRGPRPSARLRAFTLVELLVTITVIALLITLLLPALGKSRAIALRTLCAGTQRQLAIAMTAYAQDFRDAVSFSYPANWTDTTQGFAVMRFGYVIRGWGSAPAANHGLWVSTGYVAGPAMLCPDQYVARDNRWGTYKAAMKAWYGNNPTSSEMMSSYAFNGGLTRTLWYGGGGMPWATAGPYQTCINPWRVSRMGGKWPVLADLREAGGWGYGGSVVSANHDATGYNVLYASGAVKWVPLASNPSLQGIPINYQSSETTHSPLANTWITFLNF